MVVSLQVRPALRAFKESKDRQEFLERKALEALESLMLR
jgi:hypothetical protein